MLSSMHFVDGNARQESSGTDTDAYTNISIHAKNREGDAHSTTSGNAEKSLV